MTSSGKTKKFINDHPYAAQVLISYIIGLTVSVIYVAVKTSRGGAGAADIFALSVFVSSFIVYPAALTFCQIKLLARALKAEEGIKQDIGFDIWTLFLAFSYELFYLLFTKEMIFGADWQKQLVNSQTHTPVYTGSAISVAAVLIVCAAGFIVIWAYPADHLPPLVTVLCIAAIYLGAVFVTIWTVQIFKYERIEDFFLLLPPLVYYVIAAKTVAIKVKSYRPDPGRRSRIDSIAMLGRIDSFLSDSRRWPFMGVLFMLPLLALLMIILLLFGQAPNSMIKAFTETSDWNLSQQTAPQNIYQDEHYLCTVAAGGHRKVVRPLRRGIRHGHPVTVNRQLLTANAFEQILEERTPRLHKFVRGTYDKYGFPVARLIKSKWAADAVWFMMKPLEWGFLAVIYLCDRHPEDRIAMQYTGRNKEDLTET